MGRGVCSCVFVVVCFIWHGVVFSDPVESTYFLFTVMQMKIYLLQNLSYITLFLPARFM